MPRTLDNERACVLSAARIVTSMSIFTEEQQRHFDAELKKVLAKYPDDRKSAAMIPALRLCQDILGWVPAEAMEICAQRLEVPPSRSREVASFYVMLHTEKPGRHVIDLCTNVSCSMRGAERLLAHLEKRLGIRAGHTTADERFTLREAECLASCGTAPAMLVDERFHENLNESKLDQILAEQA
jgi:NADH-quinone oxidoreductase subunit E